MHLKSVTLQLKSLHNSDNFETPCKIPIWNRQEDELLRQKSNVKFEVNLCYVYLHMYISNTKFSYFQYRDFYVVPSLWAYTTNTGEN